MKKRFNKSVIEIYSVDEQMTNGMNGKKKNLKFHCNQYDVKWVADFRFVVKIRIRNIMPTTWIVFGPSQHMLCVFTGFAYLQYKTHMKWSYSQVIAIIRARRTFEILMRSQMTFWFECQSIFLLLSSSSLLFLPMFYRVSSSSVSYT